MHFRITIHGSDGFTEFDLVRQAGGAGGLRLEDVLADMARKARAVEHESIGQEQREQLENTGTGCKHDPVR